MKDEANLIITLFNPIQGFSWHLPLPFSEREPYHAISRSRSFSTAASWVKYITG